MRGNEFIKRYGVKTAQNAVINEGNKYNNLLGRTNVSQGELNRLLESHYLIEKMGGYEKVKRMKEHSETFVQNLDHCGIHLTMQAKQALADVESCQ